VRSSRQKINALMALITSPSNEESPYFQFCCTYCAKPGKLGANLSNTQFGDSNKNCTPLVALLVIITNARHDPNLRDMDMQLLPGETNSKLLFKYPAVAG